MFDDKKDDGLLYDRAQAILQKPYTWQLYRDAYGGWNGLIKEFPGCFAGGTTPEDALQQLQAAAQSWVAVMLSRGEQVPEPDYFPAQCVDRPAP